MTENAIDITHLVTRVSILVFVELALDGYSTIYQYYKFLVSILVFVELALDVQDPSAKTPFDMCFNPCFRGTCS